MHQFYPLFRPLLFAFDPEAAHDATFRALDAAARLGLAQIVAPRLPRSPVSVMGIEFPNPVGLAAGLDKNAAHLAGLATLGFGFLEVGTVTPRPQPGNPKPRMFRLRESEALINRLGFNNEGVERFVANVKRSPYRGVLGI
ncbi:MAG: quinone-dependent dihydroorotate dehydrogenase, partial [Casimicrobiaceae bacterium]